MRCADSERAHFQRALGRESRQCAVLLWHIHRARETIWLSQGAPTSFGFGIEDCFIQATLLLCELSEQLSLALSISFTIELTAHELHILMLLFTFALHRKPQEMETQRAFVKFPVALAVFMISATLWETHATLTQMGLAVQPGQK